MNTTNLAEAAPRASLIQQDGRKGARVAGTRIKVAQVAGLARQGMTPEKIAEAYPHLSASQIHAALAYYYSHFQQVENEIAASVAYADQARREAEPSPLSVRLCALKAPLGIGLRNVSK